MLKQIFETITYYTSYHINLKYLLTPIAIVLYDINNIRIRMIFIFGIRVFRTTVL